MKSFFATSVLLAGAALAAPTVSNDSCVAKSSRITDWTIEDFDFHASYIFTTPSHQNSWGYVNFTLKNEVVDYVAQCSAASNWLSDFYYGQVIYSCEVPERAGQTTFTFNRPTGEVQVNQTWSCPDQGVYYMAEGGADLDLDCTEETWENPDWEVGQIYSTRFIACEPVTVSAPIETIRGIA
ncbi:hypothetical protein B0I35DRAFT_476152 [Stachybotrys elegans]|uniref:AA1-like domain-containing protein n=1 Tax=Stachybotrys elegans TaxID=80388 RepID=A0A8K0T1L8_9HYPO|nr:hypothetical protein B0I35DRAFT_476152 [Stachybotrys elegans]